MSRLLPLVRHLLCGVFVLCQTTNLFAQQWETTFDKTRLSDVRQVAATADQGLLIAGGSGDLCAFQNVMKYNSDGTLDWTLDLQTARTFDKTASEDYLFVGSGMETSDVILLVPIVITKIDDAGTILFSDTVPVNDPENVYPTSINFPEGIREAPSGDLYVFSVNYLMKTDADAAPIGEWSLDHLYPVTDLEPLDHSRLLVTNEFNLYVTNDKGTVVHEEAFNSKINDMLWHQQVIYIASENTIFQYDTSLLQSTPFIMTDFGIIDEVMAYDGSIWLKGTNPADNALVVAQYSLDMQTQQQLFTIPTNRVNSDAFLAPTMQDFYLAHRWHRQLAVSSYSQSNFSLSTATPGLTIGTLSIDNVDWESFNSGRGFYSYDASVTVINNGQVTLDSFYLFNLTIGVQCAGYSLYTKYTNMNLQPGSEVTVELGGVNDNGGLDGDVNFCVRAIVPNSDLEPDLSDNYACQLFSGFLSTPEHTLPDANWSVYPNPTADFLSFNIPMQAGTSANLEIKDLSGRVISQQQVFRENGELDVSELVPGVYFLSLEIDGVFGHKRFVKQR